jgi:His-Xaa-Ser system protein HxsD
MKIEQPALELDGTVYSIEAVRRTAYDLAENGHFLISQTGKTILVNQLQYSNENKENFQWHLFVKTALDHQLRIDAEREFGLIRNLLITQAMEPCNNLKEILQHFKTTDVLNNE